MITTLVSYLAHAQAWALQDGPRVVLAGKSNRAGAPPPLAAARSPLPTRTTRSCAAMNQSQLRPPMHARARLHTLLAEDHKTAQHRASPNHAALTFSAELADAMDAVPVRGSGDVGGSGGT